MRMRIKERLVSALLLIDLGDDYKAALSLMEAWDHILPLVHKPDDAHGSCSNRI